MLGISFFSNRVWSRLAKSGWPPQSLPPMLSFKLLCDGLKANGYTADRAADLWNRALLGEKAALVELRSNSGVYGITFISEDGDWTGMWA